MSEQERVRRLLGDLRATDDATPPAMPDDLAARLDARLAEAAREEPARDEVAPEETARVVPLRRRLAPVLVAAAVVLVAGGVVVGLQQGSGDQATSSADAGASGAASSEAGEESAGGSAAEPEAADPGDEDGRGRLGDSTDDTGTRMTAAPYLSLARFPADVRALVRDGEVASGDAPRQDAAARDRVEGSGCAVPDADLGATTLVSLDGEPAVLVVSPVADGRQEVEVRDCLGAAVGRTTVTAR